MDIEKTQNTFEITSYDKIQEQLKKQGYCFIELPVHLQKSSSTAFNLSKQFFDNQWDNNDPQYQKFFAPPQYGYQKTQYKQSITILTGNMLEKQDKALEKLIPKENIKEALKLNAQDFDNFALQILDFLPEITQTKHFQKEVPLANENERYSLIDIVQYKNQTDHQVLPHIDPGILAISALSDTKGLQFYNNNTNSWVDGPVNQPNIGIIWTGLKTMELNKKFQGGVHQVQPNLGSLRTTMWYELITRNQVSKEVQENGMLATQQLLQQQQTTNIINNQEFSKNQLFQNDFKETDNIYDVTVHFNNPTLKEKSKFQIKCNQESTVAHFKHQMEQISGMRYSKISLNLKFATEDNQKVVDETKLIDLGLNQQNSAPKIVMNSLQFQNI